MATFYDIFRHLIVIFYLTYLSKAFGTVDHIILIAKLENYGIKGINLLWFKSYLENRKLFLQYDISSPSYKSIICGVPQGSILGPLLFLIYFSF